MLSAQWESTMEIVLQITEYPRCISWSRTTFVLVRSDQQVHNPSTDLPRQHCAALSGVADKYRTTTQAITLGAPRGHL